MLGGKLPKHVKVIAEDVAVRISERQMTAREEAYRDPCRIGRHHALVTIGVHREAWIRVGTLATMHQRTDTRDHREKSNKSMLGKRVAPAIPDDEVIEYEDVHERQQVLEAAGDEVVRRARLEGTGRMVVCKDYRRRVMVERLPQHVPGMDLSAIDRAAEELLEGDEPAAAVEIEAAEDLVIEAPEAQPQKIVNLLGSR